MERKPGGIDDANRTWDEYKWGFSTDNFLWLGLENLSQFIASTPTGTRTVLLNANYVQGNDSVKFKVHHYHFKIGDERSNYMLSYTGSGMVAKKTVIGSEFMLGNGSSTLPGDCFLPVSGAPFSTWDRDNDTAPGENCAKSAGSGWWFLGCDESCNPLLPFYQDGEEGGEERYDRVHVTGLDMRANHSLLARVIISFWDEL